MLGKKPAAMQAQGGEPAVGGYEAGSGSNWNGWRAKQPPKANTGEDTVEAHIEGLAAALGMPTNEVASAIASAVRAYVPPASLSSIAAKETGEAVRVLLQEPSQGEGEGAVPGVAAAGGSASGKKDTTGKVVEGIVTGMEAMPPSNPHLLLHTTISASEALSMDVPEPPLILTEPQAEAIIHKHLPEHRQSSVQKLTEVKNHGYSYTSKVRTYIVDIAPQPSESASLSTNSKPSSCFITIAHPPPAGHKPLALSNSLQTTHHIISLIHSQTDIPIPLPTLDTSLSLPSTPSIPNSSKEGDKQPFPYHILLSPPSPIASASILSVAAARRRGILPAQSKESTLIELQIGRFLGRLHANVQNDYFGRVRAPNWDLNLKPAALARAQVFAPATQEEEESYSWQETFTALLEALLWEAESTGAVDLPYEAIRGYLSRAISSFLFDDVEVPSLVWLTGSEEDVYVAVDPVSSTSSASSSESTRTTSSDSNSNPDKDTGSAPPPQTPPTSSIAAILPNLTHALWGDPLLETFFHPPSPTPALKEAYTQSGGQELILFPRQRTKRLWYDLLL
ncbi:hypothetical protein CVT26_012080, partial [Gymnopilus dilepis]